MSSDRRGLRTALLAFPRIRGLVAKARHGLGARAAAARGCDYRIEDALDTWLFADGAVAPLPPPAAAATGAVGHFADVLAGRTPLRPTPEQSLALQGIVDACYRSAGAGSILISPGEAEATP